MELNYIETLPLGGFNFDNCIRNTALAAQNIVTPPKSMKTGTTICGVIWKVSRINQILYINQLYYLILTLHNRMVFAWLLILELLYVQSLVTRTARRSTILLPTFSAAELVQLQTAITLLVT